MIGPEQALVQAESGLSKQQDKAKYYLPCPQLWQKLSMPFNSSPHCEQNMMRIALLRRLPCRLFAFAVAYLLLPWPFCFCRGLFAFAAALLLSPRPFCFRCSPIAFVVAVVGHRTYVFR